MPEASESEFRNKKSRKKPNLAEKYQGSRALMWNLFCPLLRAHLLSLLDFLRRAFDVLRELRDLRLVSRLFGLKIEVYASTGREVIFCSTDLLCSGSPFGHFWPKGDIEILMYVSHTVS